MLCIIMNIIIVSEVRNMSSVTNADNSMPAYAAADMPAAMPARGMPLGTNCGRPPAGQFTLKFDGKSRLRRWDQLCGDMATCMSFAF